MINIQDSLNGYPDRERDYLTNLPLHCKKQLSIWRKLLSLVTSLNDGINLVPIRNFINKVFVNPDWKLKKSRTTMID
ncbi:MAG: hypothetical protein AAF600_00690 [Bacteroidota bacterium]